MRSLLLLLLTLLLLLLLLASASWVAVPSAAQRLCLLRRLSFLASSAANGVL